MIVLDREEARRFLVSHAGLARPLARRRSPAAARKLLERLCAIQLDPLDPMGTNADLVALARIDGLKKGDIYRFVMPHHGFEHFAKERCILPASAFPQYRDRAVETPWWQHGERHKRVGDATLARVLAEVEANGPVTASELSDHGRVEPIHWSSWGGTSRAATMALDVLWTSCRVVVAGRRGREKLFDVPRRALPDHFDRPAQPFERWALISRVEAAGLLRRASGPQWSMLSDIRKSPLVGELIDEGAIEEVGVEGFSRGYLAPGGFRKRKIVAPDDRMRLLGPLDPLIWDRDLVRHVFGFDYVWEVYKPEKLRRFGWYVCPLLQHGRLVGRLSGRLTDRTLVIDRVWREKKKLDVEALDRMLERHAESIGADAVKRTRKVELA
jgi:uncharacterized protein YcaQ